MLLTAVTFLPALGGLVLLLVPRRVASAFKVGGRVVTLATLLLSVPLYFGFDGDVADFQFEEARAWMPDFGISYHLGIDGISLLLVLLTTFLMPVALASAWHAIEDRWKEFVVTMLILETGMLGVFVSLDLFLFYVFWEAMLIPMYFVIGVWGGANRIYAAIKFVLYTMVGSVLMLVAILMLYAQHGAATGTYTFDLLTLTRWVVPPGLAGGVLQMVNHGLSTGALFLLVGMIYERRHTRLIADFGGLWSVVPAFSALFLVVVLSSLGLPGLNGFVGEFLVLVGAFQTNPWLAALATSGIIFAAVYLLWLYQRVIFGAVTHEANRGLRDLSPREWALLAPIVVLIVWIGVYPTAFTGKTEATIEALIAQVQAKANVQRISLGPPTVAPGLRTPME